MTAARGRTELLLEKLRADIAPEDKQQVERDLAALRRRVVWITVTTDHVGTVLTDVRLPDRGLAIQNLYPMPMAAELRFAGYCCPIQDRDTPRGIRWVRGAVGPG